MRYYQYLKYTFIFLFLIYQSAQSQNKIKIQGVMVDSLTNETLPYGTIALLNLLDSSLVKGVVTDEKGRFELTEVFEGNYLLRASYIGYVQTYFPLHCTAEKKLITLDTIRINSAYTSLGGVTIIEKKPIFSFEGEKMVYNVSEDPGIQIGTLSDALQNAPGVEVDIEGNVTLRGVSSVEIWINDKPSKLTAENLKTYIQQLPANILERIEVITNPSAKYATEGAGGIINIVTSSKILKNSFISFGAFGSTRPLVSPWLSFMWANEKLSINIYLNGSYTRHKSQSNGYSLLFNDQKDTASFQSHESENKSNSYNGNCFLNLSYAFDTMNTLSLWASANGGISSSANEAELYRKKYIPFETVYHYSTHSNSKSNNQNLNGNINYQHKFNNKGHRINISFGGNLSGNTSNNDYIRDYVIQNEFDKDKKRSVTNHDYGLNAQIDYTIPYIKDGEISMGISENFNKSNGLSYEDTLLSEKKGYVLDSMRVKDNLSLANSLETYLSLRHSFGNFTISLGCRFQFKQVDYQIINSPKDNVKGNYPGLFPSLHMSYRTKSMHNFRVSYTRRISYPNPSQLSTFIHYDEESFSLGNPLLEPTYSHAMDGGWSKYFKKIGDIGLSGYLRYTKNEITSLSDVIYSDFYGRIVTYSMPMNSGSGYQAGGEFRFNYRFKSFINLRFYANVYQSHSETKFDYPETSLRNDTLIVTESFSYSLRLNYWAKLFKVLEINASASYRSPTKSLYIENKATYSIDCGLRADFFKRKLSVFLNVRDIFNWNKQEYNRESPYYKSFSSTKYDSRFISTGITLRFGKIEMESRAREGQMPE